MTANKQSGVALITAMIITTIAVSIAALVMYRQQIQIRLSSNISHLEQSYLYANGMEDWAGTILEKSYEDHPEYDSLLDDWYSDNGLVLPITGGLMQGKLYDLQARINLNSLNKLKASSGNADSELVTGNETGEDSSNANVEQTQDETTENVVSISELTRKRLTNLIRKIDPDQDIGAPEKFAYILKDWIDEDQISGNKEPEGDSIGDGAESPYYQSLEPAYYSADTEFVSPTELRLLKDMNEKTYKELIKYTSTLPIEIDTPINVNTASAMVLEALGFTPNEVEDIVKERKEEAFKDINTFRKLSFVAGSLISKDNPDGGVSPNELSVNSNYFLLQGKVEINNARLFINSILERKKGQVSVIMRDFSNPQTITKAIN